MEKEIDQNVDSITAGFGISASAAIIFNTILVWAKESIPSLMAWMKSLTTHHWITQGLFVIGVFLILGALLSNRKIKLRNTTLTWLIMLSSAFGGLGIIFFNIHF